MFFSFSSYWKGILAEFYVCLFYFFVKKCVVLDWRFKSKLGEVDLIFKKRKMIIFAEVKYRKNSDLFDVVNEVSLRRIQNTAKLYLKSHRKYQSYQARIDVCYVTQGLRLQHKENVTL